MAFAMVVSATAYAQKLPTLEFNRPTKITISVGEVKEFTFDGKQGDFWEIKTVDQSQWFLFFELFGPDGEDLLEKQNGLPPVLVLPTDGRYKVRTFISKDAAEEGKPGPYNIEFIASNVFTLPKGSKKHAERTVNGYHINIYKSEEEYQSALEILKGEKRVVYLLGDSNFPFEFAESAVYGSGAAAKREKQVWKTSDKTGDGVPDIAIQYYSGGAHCCYDYYFFELGEDVVQRPALYTADAGISAMRVLPGGGIRVRTADMTFAYWNIHFAGSPAPTVMIDFKNGNWRPNFAAMKKPAPPLVKLKTMAAKARKLMNNKPYRGDEFAGLQDDGYIFEEAFWGVMLNLIYTGNEKQAWQFFDEVWPKTKPGKDIFVKDFKSALSKSEFWRMILEDRVRTISW